MGFSNDINVLFLDGYYSLGEKYKKSLYELGYSIYNCEDIYKEINSNYNILDRFGDGRKKCFLRWLVIDKFFPNEKIIHYDGDIVFNENPKIIKEKFANKTFVLQGCPAITSVSDSAWFIEYKKHLDLYAKNIEQYSNDAWEERNGWEITFNTRWAGSRFTKLMCHDQDLISHLIHTGRIIQDPLEKIMLDLKDYIIFENPLFVHTYDLSFPFYYSRENGIDYF